MSTTKSVKNNKAVSFKKSIENLNTSIKDQLLALGVSGGDINEVLNCVDRIQSPSRKKTLGEIDSEELDNLSDPKVYNKLSDKNKALYHLRCYSSPNASISLPSKNDTVSVKKFYSHMNMLGEHSVGCLVTFSDSLEESEGFPGVSARVFAKRVNDYAHELALTGFTDACGAVGFVLDPNRDEFKAYPKYVQKWLSQMLRSTTQK